MVPGTDLDVRVLQFVKQTTSPFVGIQCNKIPGVGAWGRVSLLDRGAGNGRVACK